MIMVCWNASGNGRKRWKFSSAGPLHSACDGVKCNYIIYWSEETGMELVDKWETEGKTTEAIGTTLQGTLNFLQNTSHLNLML